MNEERNERHENQSESFTKLCSQQILASNFRLIVYIPYASCLAAPYGSRV